MALKFSWTPSQNLAQLGPVTGLESYAVVGAPTAPVAAEATAKQNVEGILVTAWERPNEDPATVVERLWRKFFDDPTLWWDSRANKRNPRGPDFRHASTGEGLWINNMFTPDWVQAKLNSLQKAKAGLDRAHWAPEAVENGLASLQEQNNVERLWLKYFKDPREWWDNRDSKLHPKSPDFRHKTTKEALWIDISDTPRWVAGALRTSSIKADGRTSSSPARSSGDALALVLSDRDVASWTALISEHVKSGQARLALQVFEEMQEVGVQPSSYTFIAALKACRSVQDLETTKRIHQQVVKRGFDSIIFVGNMLIDVYGKCGRLVDARLVFDKMHVHNVVSWNAMISVYAQMEKGEEALKLYARMQQEGVVPNDRTFVSALKACSTLVSSEGVNEADGQSVKQWGLQQVRAIHSVILQSRSKFNLAVHVGTILVYAYAKCGSLTDARHVFEKMPHRNVVSWNAMIEGYATMEKGEEGLQLYAKMKLEGVVPDDRTFVSALKACSNLAAREEVSEGDGSSVKRRCLEQIRAIHTDVVERNFESDVFVGTMLVDVYAKCGSLVDARNVFEKMPQRNVVSWNVMILGYVQRGEGEVGLQLYTRMQREGVIPDDRTFVGALKAWSILANLEEPSKGDGKYVKKRSLEQVRGLHLDIFRRGLASTMFVETMLVDVYAKCGSLVDARRVFEKMPHRDVVSWNAMILGYAQMEEGELALQLFARMQQEGVVPDEGTYVGALKACGVVAGLEKGQEIHDQITKLGPESSGLFLQTSLIDMYGKCGSTDNAQQVFDALPTRDVVTWSALIAGYAHQGESQQVFSLFQRMRQDSIQPDGITFLSVLTSCSHAGLVDKGQMYFNTMSRDFGISPSIDHFTCMVDLLGRAGQVDKAMAMVKRMPFQPDAAVWQTLLAACRKWKNVEVGRQAFECAVKYDKNDAAPYVLMSNIYAAAHMLEEAKEVKAMRTRTRAWKKPGQSWWTDMSGMVHVFVVGDKDHPESQDIYKKLRNLIAKMKVAGYVPHLDSVLLDIPDNEKEEALCGHSEKLAIAYALLKTPAGTTIRVVKNLRVCEDCHMATALISKVEQRTIICRDASRFHVYKDGKCSCGDYW